MKPLLITVLLGLLLTSCREELPPETIETPTAMQNDPVGSTDSLLRHAVFFAFNEGTSGQQIDSVQRAFSALPEQIDVIRDYEWGVNNSPENLNKGFTHAFFVTFASEADREVYLPHPAHLAFVEVLQPHLKDVFVVDYWTK